MALTFTPATKKALKARVALAGPAGSGKTMTALILARALVGPTGTFGVIDTEHGRARLYGPQDEADAGLPNIGQFDHLDLDRFGPDVLVEALAVSAAAGHDATVVDSLSHFWMGVDGMLEAVDRAARRSGSGNSFAGWKEMRPAERRMVEAMLAHPGHLIVTMRTKTEWVIEQNERGKNVPRKVGTRPEQREGIEYEFDLVGDMDLENVLVVSKSRCPALSGAVVQRPGPDFGRTLLQWLNAGERPTETAQGIRDEILADSAMGSEEVKARGRRARAAGLLATAIVDENGDTTTLGDWLSVKVREAQEREAQPATAAPDTASLPPGRRAQMQAMDRAVAARKAAGNGSA